MLKAATLGEIERQDIPRVRFKCLQSVEFRPNPLQEQLHRIHMDIDHLGNIFVVDPP